MMDDAPSWPAWATAKINDLSRAEARNNLASAQAFWRDFALAGLTLADLSAVIEERRRMGPGGRLLVPPKSVTLRVQQTPARADNSLFDEFPPLDPDDARWRHV